MKNLTPARWRRWHWPAILISALIFSASISADDPQGGADINPYFGGTFARPIPSSADLLAYDNSLAQFARKPRRPSQIGQLMVDDSGQTNELMVLADDNNMALRALIPALQNSEPGQVRAEDALVLGVESGDAQVIANFGNPIDARYVVDNDRADAATRELFAYDDPFVLLQRFTVLRYKSIDEALEALDLLEKTLDADTVGVNPAVPFSSRLAYEPNDAYYAFDSLNVNYGYGGATTWTNEAQFQWGLQKMRFPLSWQISRGHGYIGDIDASIEEVPNPQRWDMSKFRWPLAKHPDLAANYRPQFSNYDIPYSLAAHGTHVSGILAAGANNGIGVAGACPDCSFAMVRRDGVLADDATDIQTIIQRGLQVFNMSWGSDDNTAGMYANWNCPGPAPPPYAVAIAALCAGLSVASTNDILPVAASGNFAQTSPNFPARVNSVLAVAGAEYVPTSSYGWMPWAWTVTPHTWNVMQDDGTNYAGINGVTAPAKSIVSTFPTGAPYNPKLWVMCGDYWDPSQTPPRSSDESGPPRTATEAPDGYSSCTGTSMAAPHITALAGNLRSINPLLTSSQIQDLIRASSDHYHSNLSLNDPTIGSGMPDAYNAVTTTVATNPSHLTPLFAFYSAARSDRFYTTVPQMAAVAVMGTLEPRGSGSPLSINYAPQGNTIYTYGAFPGIPAGFSPAVVPQAEAWIFTTPANPVNPSDPLVPLYRLSWKCGDDTPVPPAAVCTATSQQHIDIAYVTTQAAVTAFKNVGYQLDGIEGYVFPKTSPQPSGAVKLLSKYNPTLDDNAIFPESVSTSYAGYTASSEPDGWLGYVYPNTGPIPSGSSTHYVKRTATFPTQTTTSVRLVCNNSINSYCRITEIETQDNRNWAAAANGAVASASSTYVGAGYLPSAAINGDRTGVNWGSGGGWNDNTIGAFPDWLEVDFSSGHVIDNITVYSLQDNYPSPAEPDDTLTFTRYGLTDFDVQILDAFNNWVTVGSVTGNNLVKRKVNFTAVSTFAVRVVCNYALTYGGAFSRIVEVEASDDRNWSAASNGGTVSASSTLSGLYPVSAVIDGDRKGVNWGNGGGWNDATANTYGDWVQVNFASSKTLNQLTLYTLQDNFTAPVEPTDAMTFTLYGITGFTVQAWNGSTYVNVATITN